MNKALILTPCCKDKQESAISFQRRSEPVRGTQPLRDQLLREIKLTPEIANRRENQDGILNPSSRLTKALDLYTGQFYKAAGDSLRKMAEGRYNTIDVLIISAIYGLVKLDEGLKKYEVKMGDALHNGIKIYKFWQQQKLGHILGKYIEEHAVTHVWSLLPDSMPETPYNRVLNQLWEELRNSRVECYWVKLTPSQGSGTSYKRGQWLKAVLERVLDSTTKLLTGEPPPERFGEIPESSFYYQVLNR